MITDTSYSQSSQDLFVLYLLKNKINGTFVDIGCGHPININNTYLLEKYNWTGISIDFNQDYHKLWKHFRTNLYSNLDAFNINYDELFTKNFNDYIIDYLSLDIDDRYTDVLKLIPFDKYKFRVITIEHDFYIHGDLYRKQEREFLTKHGYQLLCGNVKNSGNIYEDWWVHPELVSDYQHLKSDEFEYTDIISKFVE